MDKIKVFCLNGQEHTTDVRGIEIKYPENGKKGIWSCEVFLTNEIYNANKRNGEMKVFLNIPIQVTRLNESEFGDTAFILLNESCVSNPERWYRCQGISSPPIEWRCDNSVMSDDVFNPEKWTIYIDSGGILPDNELPM